MDFSIKQNPAPIIHDVAVSDRDKEKRKHSVSEQGAAGTDNSADEDIDNYEVYEIIRTIIDPEHPYTLEQLSVVSADMIKVDSKNSRIGLQFTPTIEHCSLATLIGLCIRVKLLRTMPQRFKIDISLTPGSHSTEDQVNKQLADKERYSAAMENPSLRNVVERCIKEPDY